MLKSKLLPSCVTFAALILAFSSLATVVSALPPLLPVPADVHAAEGRLRINSKLTIALTGTNDLRLQRGVARALRRWEERMGITFARSAEGEFVFSDSADKAGLVIACEAPARALPALGDDEAYSLEINSDRATLKAANGVGALRGLETLLQLLQTDAEGWSVAAATIHDQPRFPWRGLMIDVCRHWQPIEVIKRNLDGMALVKLNVLHLHLSEDQGFRIESKTHPELQQKGSDGNFFTQDQIRDIIAYATDRGIRVVPEFDIPGHATSWVVSHPELASAPGPYVIERKWGIFNPVLDPTNEATYALLEDVLGEMANLFPDPFFHIGGDENNGAQWNANAGIQAYINKHNLEDNAGLHAYFNQRVHAILAKHGKRIVGWDEILHPDLPKDSLVHSWRGPEGLADAARQGFSVILSNGYYIDLNYPAVQHYLNDPLPVGTRLTAKEQTHVLGGEATMWSEWVSPETIDSRIWPRTAAIAERLWSPRDVNDVPDMYRRLAVISRRLEEAGLNHERNRPAMIRRLAGDQATPEEIESLSAFVDVVEPVKQYARGSHHKGATQALPLGALADCARPESDAAREFATAVRRLLDASGAKDAGLRHEVEQQLTRWLDVGNDVVALARKSPRLVPASTVARALVDASTVGIAALDSMGAHGSKDAGWKMRQLAALEGAAVPQDAVELPIIAAIRKLVEAAAP